MADYTQAIDRIVELANPIVVEANGEKYIKEGYTHAPKMTDEYTALVNKNRLEATALAHEHNTLKSKLGFNAAKPFERITSLSSLCDMLKSEVEREAAALPLFVSVEGYNAVRVYGSYEVDFSRRQLYSAKADNEHFDFGSQPLEMAIVTLQSRYVNGGDIEYVIKLCSEISKQASVTTEDNGLTQKVQTNKGIALKSNETVRNRVKLSPFRTFMEIEQPESEHLLRLSEVRDDIFVSLIESDGGAWKLTAKNNIAEYLKKNLADLIKDKKVIILQ